MYLTISQAGMPTLMTQPKRKYLSEFAVSLFSSNWAMIPSNQIASGGEIDSEGADLLAKCHIYVICKRPALSFSTQDFSYRDGVISGHLVFRKQGSVTTSLFTVRRGGESRSRAVSA
jgi:hypothetical protein